MKYDEEFKRQTVRKVLDGQSVRSVSREIGVSESQIHTAVGKEQLSKMVTATKAELR
jgi:transposase-like protein